jgi:hypothetical protein
VASSSTNVLQIQPMLKNKAHLMQKMASDSSEGNIDILKLGTFLI